MVPKKNSDKTRDDLSICAFHNFKCYGFFQSTLVVSFLANFLSMVVLLVACKREKKKIDASNEPHSFVLVTFLGMRLRPRSRVLKKEKS